VLEGRVVEVVMVTVNCFEWTTVVLKQVDIMPARAVDPACETLTIVGPRWEIKEF